MPQNKYKSRRDSMGFMASLGASFQHNMTENVFLDTVAIGFSDIYSRLNELKKIFAFRPSPTRTSRSDTKICNLYPPRETKSIPVTFIWEFPLKTDRLTSSAKGQACAQFKITFIIKP